MSKPLAICIEDLDAQSQSSRYIRCVALPGRQPGLRLDEAGRVLWQSDDDVSCELWVSADERLILYRPQAGTPATLHRAGRSLDVPCSKPVVVIDQDEIDVGSRRLRVHVHGAAPAVAAPSFLTATYTRRTALAMGAGATAAAAISTIAATAGCTATPTIEVRDYPPLPTLPEPPAPEPETVTIFVGFDTGTAAEQIAVHDAIAQEYNAQGGRITLEFLTVPYAENQSKFSTMLAADLAPDICMPIGMGGVSTNYEAWDDITPYIERDAYDLGVFFGPTVELHFYPEKGVLGLPVGLLPTGVFYNADLFDAAGVDYLPQRIGDPYADGSEWTYDKMVEIAKALTIDSASNNAASPAFNWEETTQWGWNGWDWNSMKQFPAKWGGNNVGISADYKTVEMNSEAWVGAWTFHKNTIWDWHIRTTGEQAGRFYAVAGDPMGSGMVGMWENHSWMAWAYGSWTESFSWNVGAVPAVTGFDPVSAMHANTFTMVKAAHHKDAAWEVIKWLFQPDILKRLCDNYGDIPANQELAATWVDDQKAKFPDIDFGAFVDAIPYLDNPQSEKWMPGYAQMMTAVDNAVSLINSGENLNVEEILNNLDAEVQGYVDEYWGSQ
jgi:multiple sugar transport system substrate-binding protein